MEGDKVKTPHGTGVVLKRDGQHVRVEHTDGPTSWVSVGSIVQSEATTKEKVVVEKAAAEKAAVESSKADSATDQRKEAFPHTRERYTGTTALRPLLTHDEALGGVPVKLLRARWMLEHFQAEGAPIRLEHRQSLERDHPEAFVQGEMLERVLAEIESGEVGGGRTSTSYVKRGGTGIEINFPSVGSLSHMWLRPEHADPEGRNLRERWLPALEWVYSERVRSLREMTGWGRAYGADGVNLSDEAVLAISDFGVFIDLASMVQKDGGNEERTPAEQRLFKHALGNMDIMLASFLSTKLPDGVDNPRGYNDRGWTCFERAEGQLIKPDALCIDIGRFSVDEAYEQADGQVRGSTEPRNPDGAVRIGGARFAERTVGELSRQGSYESSFARGTLGSLAGVARGPPLTPEAFAAVLATKTFTNGADLGPVVELYRTTAVALLGSIDRFDYDKLAWGPSDYAHLGSALRYCDALKELWLKGMGLGCGDVTALLATPPPSLRSFGLIECESVASLPDLSALVSLRGIYLNGCTALTSLPDLSALVSLEVLNLTRCSSLTSLPDLSTLASLQWLELHGCTSLVSLPDVSALSSLKNYKKPEHLQ